MTKVKKDKKIPLLESSFEEILVCKKNNLRSRIEIFIQKPENISQQNLGSLAGFFEITDDSEDSSYIVNYLVSVIKKEYYSREKRGSVESFEAALHKINLALAKMAEHGNTSWIGKINAIISITEKNNIHIAQTGKVRALLLRGKTLTNISEGATENETSNPLKTFVDVLSGRMEKDDKMILTTEDIFEIFSFEEIKKSALKFSDEAFVQFLKTALVNELEKASLILVKIKEKEAPKPYLETEKNETPLNAFSQAAFSKYTKNKSAPKNITSEEKQTIISEIKEDLQKESNDFVDKKTGHIYIKEDSFLKNENSILENFLENGKSKIESFKKNISVLKWKKDLPTKSNIQLPEKEDIEEILEVKNEETEKPKKELRESWKNFTQKTIQIFSKLFLLAKNLAKIVYAKTKNGTFFILEKIYSLGNILWNNLKKNSSAFSVFIAKKIEKMKTKKTTLPNENEIGYSKEEIAVLLEKKSVENIKIENYPQNIETEIKIGEEKVSILKNIFWAILPKFGKIKSLFLALNKSQKIYALLLIFALFVFPYLFIKFQNKPQEKNVFIETKSVVIIPLENDKNVSRITDLAETNLEKDILKIVNLKEEMFAIGKNEIIDIKNNKKYPVPTDFSEIEKVSPMDDLNFIFIFNKNNRILSWSPASRKFQENQIIFPEKTELDFPKTYLTYLYVLDKKNNQIYRYPRAEGGFGAHKNWLKESIELNGIIDLAINENVFLLKENGELDMFYQGKKQPFSIEETATKIKADKLYAKRNNPHLYILDKTNSRIIKLSADGKIISQFYNSEIARVSDFEINETANTIYFSVGNKILNFKM